MMHQPLVVEVPLEVDEVAYEEKPQPKQMPEVKRQEEPEWSPSGFDEHFCAAACSKYPWYDHVSYNSCSTEKDLLGSLLQYQIRK